MERLLRTIPCQRGELFSTTGGNRILLALCEPVIKIYEHSSRIPILGSGYEIKSLHAALVLCEEPDLTREVDENFFRTVTGFDLTADLPRNDGVFERTVFSNVCPREINLGGDWIFEIGNQPDLIQKLLQI